MNLCLLAARHADGPRELNLCDIKCEGHSWRIPVTEKHRNYLRAGFTTRNRVNANSSVCVADEVGLEKYSDIFAASPSVQGSFEYAQHENNGKLERKPLLSTLPAVCPGVAWQAGFFSAICRHIGPYPRIPRPPTRRRLPKISGNCH